MIQYLSLLRVFRLVLATATLSVFLAANAQAQAPFFMAANQSVPSSQAAEKSMSHAHNSSVETLPQPTNAPPAPMPDTSSYSYSAPIQQQIMPNYAVASARPFQNPIGCGPVLSAGNRAASCPRCGVDEGSLCCCGNGSWKQKRTLVDFNQYGQGEYVGPPRLHHVDRYRMRVDDQVTLVYRLTRELNPTEYELSLIHI